MGQQLLVNISDATLLGLVPLLPLLGSLVTYLVTNRSERLHALSGWCATLFSVLAFSCVYALCNRLGEQAAITSHFWTWFTGDKLSVEFALRFDKLSQVMTLVVTGVGSLIHLYAIGYMHEDEHRPRFFAYLNLFLFAMLLLVLGDNLLLLFVGWEGVGLCSYLLIGFWFKDMENAKAGQKAFVVNRIGDAGFVLGIFLLITSIGVIDFPSLQAAVGGISPRIIELIAFCLFVGAVGKSAQIPLFVWLPDAMAGPTPVSALIHAATMVTAGVYMVTRMSFLYVLAPVTLTMILIVGTLTAFVAATIALAQNDIKKVLAYSTVSQLGYMFMALGSGAFSNGIFHVVTHAFFKACLFMAAGSVIMGCHHEQDMRHFGGLWKKMPLTFIPYFGATLAIAGFPYTSGFFSKDAILWTVFSNSGLPSTITLAGFPLSHICWVLAVVTAFLTAFYMTRSLALTFFGSYRGHHEAHESPAVVWIPLMILVALSIVFGKLWGEHLMHHLSLWTRSDMLLSEEQLVEHNPMFHTLEVLSMVVAVSGIVLSLFVYCLAPAIVARVAQTFSGVHKFLLGKWWFDELYQAIVIGPLGFISRTTFSVLDRSLIDGSVEGLGMVVQANGEVLHQAHGGRIGAYLLAMFAGFLFLLLFWLLL